MAKTLTPQTPRDAHRIAASAGRDAANRQMRAAGRSAWSRADAALAADEMMRLYRAFGLLNAEQWLPEGWTWAEVDGEWQLVVSRVTPSEPTPSQVRAVRALADRKEAEMRARVAAA